MQFNEAQKARLAPMLPVGMPIETAAEGFKNRGQFMAAAPGFQEPWHSV